jgi:hypothetical protein
MKPERFAGSSSAHGANLAMALNGYSQGFGITIPGLRLERLINSSSMASIEEIALERSRRILVD